MGANIAGIYGAQIFRSEDAPRYRRGFGINIGVLALGLALAVLRFADDKWWRRTPAPAVSDEAGEEHESESDKGARTERQDEKKADIVF